VKKRVRGVPRLSQKVHRPRLKKDIRETNTAFTWGGRGKEQRRGCRNEKNICNANKAEATQASKPEGVEKGVA